MIMKHIDLEYDIVCHSNYIIISNINHMILWINYSYSKVLGVNKIAAKILSTTFY